jgi:hypothetical protein
MPLHFNFPTKVMNVRLVRFIPSITFINILNRNRTVSAASSVSGY